MNRVLRSATCGATAGAGATVAMTVFMEIAQAAGALGELPPKKITEQAFRALGIKPSKAALVVATGAAHLMFGATVGIALSLLRDAGLLAKGKSPAIQFATGVWAIAYEGIVPALGIMPKPKADRPLRPTMMVVAHAIYGATFDSIWKRMQDAHTLSRTRS